MASENQGRMTIPEVVAMLRESYAACLLFLLLGQRVDSGLQVPSFVSGNTRVRRDVSSRHYPETMIGDPRNAAAIPMGLHLALSGQVPHVGI